jgi:putative transposase
MVRVGLVGAIVKSFVTKRRDKKTTLKFLRKSLRWHGQTEGFVTDRLAFDGADLKQRGTINKREVGRWLNHRIGNSHQPF